MLIIRNDLMIILIYFISYALSIQMTSMWYGLNSKKKKNLFGSKLFSSFVQLCKFIFSCLFLEKKYFDTIKFFEAKNTNIIQ